MINILEELPVLVCNFLPDTTLTYVNKEFSVLFDKKETDLIGKKLNNLISKYKSIKFDFNINNFSVQKPKNSYILLINDSDKISYIEWTDKAIFDNTGKIIEFISYGIDITDQVLLKQDFLFKMNMLDKVSDSVILHEFSGKILYANETTLKILNITFEELLKMNVKDIIGSDNKKLYDKRTEMLIKNKYLIFDSDFLTVNNKTFPYEVNACIINYNGKELILSICRDITERKDKEEKLNKFELKLIQKSKELQKLNKKLNKQVEKNQEYLTKLNKKNIALEEVLNNFENKKNNIKKFFSGQIDMLIIPLLKKLELRFNNGFEKEKEYIKLCRAELKRIISNKQISKQEQEIISKLSPRQFEICKLIQNGLCTKDISKILNISVATVEQHRFTIRKKLKIKQNLYSYLKSLVE